MKVSELTGADLDIWVARALEIGEQTGVDKYGGPLINGRRSLAYLIEKYRDFPQTWSPSTKWEDGGPIIEAVRINLHSPSADFESKWIAAHPSRFGYVGEKGETALVAAMRAFVRTKFGDTVCEK